MSNVARRAAPAFVALAAAIVAVLVGRWLFPAFSPDHDEPLYLFQAQLLERGHVTLPLSHDQFFRPWLSGTSGDRLIFVFQPVWPALLALSHVLTGAFWPAKAAMAALAVTMMVLFTRALTDDRTVAVVAAATVAASPMFAFTTGTYLAYTLSLTILLGFGTLVLRAARVGSFRLFVTAGACLGLLAFTRPLDAILAGGAAASCITVVHRTDIRRLLSIAGSLSAGVVPGVVACLAYNAHLTGAPFDFALQAIGGNNGFGFGTRQIAEGTTPVPFGVMDSLWAMQATLRRVPAWSFGHVLSLPVAAFGAWRLRRRPTALAVLAIVFVAWPAANLLYWGNLLIARGRDYLGPLYYLPLVAGLALLTAVGLVEVARRDRRIASALVAVMVVATALGVARPAQLNVEHRRERNADAAAVAAAVGRTAAVVILPRVPDGGWLMHPRPNLGNDPDLRQRVIYATDRGAENFALTRQFPERRLFRLSERMIPDPDVIFGLMPRPEVKGLRVVAGAELRVPWRVDNHSDGPVVSVYVSDGRRVILAVIDERSARGRTYEGTWTVRADGAIELDPAPLEFLARSFTPPLGQGTLRVGVSIGDIPDPTSTAVWEDRYWYETRHGQVAFLAPGETWLRRAGATEEWLATEIEPYFTVGPPCVSSLSAAARDRC